MTSPAELADYEWLTGEEAAQVLRDLGGRDEPVHALAARLRKQHSAERTHLLLEQVELRERAKAKFDRARDMFFTRIGLEQATDEWVGGHKARRFAANVSEGSVADFCCGIGGDLISLAAIGPTIGVDRDPIAGCLATANARAAGEDEKTSLRIADIETLDLREFAAWHLDPDRRPQGKRTTALDWSSPSTAVIEQLLVVVPHAAVKLAPAADVPKSWAVRCELEWISRDRECRQLVAWHGALAEAPGKCRSTALSSDGSTTASFVGSPNEAFGCSTLDQFLFEPDAAVLAAHLGGALAREQGLSAVSAGIAFLTGPRPVASPLLTCFEVEEVLPLDLRKVGDVLRERGIGKLEIKKRGVEHDPHMIRKKLHLQGSDSGTLVLTKLAGKHAAILARRCVRAHDSPSLSPVS